jgi:hypothetical protein
MKRTVFQFSSVVVSEAHNPTILNPNFLETEGIVPKSWGWEVVDTITTPPFAMVRYSNGITITVEQNKLQVTDSGVGTGIKSSKATEIAWGYVKTLRHAHYTAVGNNFQTLIQAKSPDAYLKKHFLKKGPWDGASRALDAVGVRLVYSLNPGRFTLSIDSGKAKTSESATEQAVIIANANFDRNCGSHPAFKQVSVLLKKAIDDWETNELTLGDIFKEEK